ncbi:hypothetical protein BJV78DRAFT_1215217 [Lactifluus subvellereus]|nr:hypothetical protein BJV78DRAFT_1215217 [Lactifluus subvellereus]
MLGTARRTPAGDGSMLSNRHSCLSGESAKNPPAPFPSGASEVAADAGIEAHNPARLQSIDKQVLYQEQCIMSYQTETEGRRQWYAGQWKTMSSRNHIGG